MNKLKVGVIFGGMSTEHDVSISSGTSIIKNLSKEKYGIEDEEICSAVRYHTTGKPAMSVLEAIVFTADYIEPGRKVLSNFKLIRSMAFVDLDEAVYLILKNTLSYLNDEKEAEQSQKEIDKHSVEAYKYYKKIHDEKVGH